MTKVEYIESKREGMVQLYLKLDEFYKREGAFDYLELENIEEMIRDLDKDNFKTYKKDVGYACCRECDLYPKINGKNPKVRYPEDVEFIRTYMTNEEIYTDVELEELWEQFSEDEYCAGHMRLWQGGVEEFEEWLKNREKG